MDHPAFFEARLAARRALAGLRPAGSKPSVLREAERKRGENARGFDQNARARRDRGEPGEEPGRGSAPLALVALSGGADSLALAAAVAVEAGAAGVRAGAVVVDHALQDGSAEVAERAATAAREIGLAPVLVRRVRVDTRGGPEAAARRARYDALAAAAAETGAVAILTAHTRDDQAEQVLLALARGSGLRSLAGIPARREIAPGGPLVLRPFLAVQPEITRRTTETACAELGLEPWRDPHNGDPAYLRVRARERALPVLEAELGPGVAAALARTADLARDDAEALDAIAEAALGEFSFEPGDAGRSTVRLPVERLAEQPAAIRNRMIRLVAHRGFGSHLSRDHALAVAALVTSWRGQGPIHVPGIRVTRDGGDLLFASPPRSDRRSAFPQESIRESVLQERETPAGTRCAEPGSAPD